MQRASRLALRREQTGVRAQDVIQRERDRVATSANLSPMFGGTIISEEPGAAPSSGLAFTAGQVRSIAHGLGRRATSFLELYGPDTPSAARVGLFAVAHPSGITSDTHVTVQATSAGTCFLVVL